jgi:hypothetical protein
MINVDYDNAVGMHNPFTMEPPEQRDEVDDTRREDEPGDWFIADFDGECSRCGREFGPNVTVRADSDGDHECKTCVDEDERKRADQDAYEAELLTGRPFGEDWTRKDCEQAATFWTMPAELWGEFS